MITNLSLVGGLIAFAVPNLNSWPPRVEFPYFSYNVGFLLFLLNVNSLIPSMCDTFDHVRKLMWDNLKWLWIWVWVEACPCSSNWWSPKDGISLFLVSTYVFGFWVCNKHFFTRTNLLLILCCILKTEMMKKKRRWLKNDIVCQESRQSCLSLN